MSKEETATLLTNLKLIYQNGVSHSKNSSKLHRLLAIHNCHYIVEQTIREKAKDQSFSGALREINFEGIIKKLNVDMNIPDFSHLLELNKIRNNAEHFFIIPDIDDVRFYVRVVGDFLKWSYRNYFGVDYDSINFEGRIYDVAIRRVMFEAKDYIEAGDLENASKKMWEGLAAFKFMWFKFLLDPRGEVIFFSEGESFANVLADLALRIILSEDKDTLEKLLLIRTGFKKDENGKIIGVESKFPTPPYENREKAIREYDEILNIILTYQDRVPEWRDK